MDHATPDEYLEPFLSSFPFYQDFFRSEVPKYLELGAMHPRACEFTTEEMFYGAVLVALQAPGVVVSVRKERILLEMTKCWGRASKSALLIK